MKKLFVLMGLIALAACQGDHQPGDPPASELKANRAACEADGGTFQRGGLLAQFYCLRPNPDAGQACTTSDECVGFCMSETRTCQAKGPSFGCQSFLDENGETQEICID